MCITPIKVLDGEGNEVKVPCGKCILCRSKRASDWTIKLINEAKYHKKACFITLTFDNKILADPKSKAYKYISRDKKTGKPKEPLPSSFLWNIDNSKKYMQKFIKRLRKHYKDTKITYYLVGEYGDKFKRPHYHMIIFGINFDDERYQTEVSQSGKIQYFSPVLDKLWALGRTRITDLNSKTIAYTAGYCVKKQKELNKENYKNNYIPVNINEETGAIKWKYKYKTRQSFSNRSKISSKWIKKRPEAILKGYLTDEDGKKYAVPKSYIKALREENRPDYLEILGKYEERIEKYIKNTNKDEKFLEEKYKKQILENRQRRYPRADF